MNNFDNSIPEDIADEVLKLASYLHAQQNQEGCLLGKLPTPDQDVEIPPELIEEALEKVKEKRFQEKIRKEQAEIKQKKAKQKQTRSLLIQIGAGATVAITIGITCWGINTANFLATKHEKVETAWVDLENKFQQRADLIPYIVKVTETYAPEYEDVIIQLNEARDAYLEAEGMDEKLEAITQVNEAIDKFGINVFDYEVVAINNSYYNSYRRNYGSYRRDYEARKIEAFDKLYTDVVRSNNTFTSALSKYNETVESYNEEITSFPNIIISIMTGLEPGMPIVTY